MSVDQDNLLLPIESVKYQDLALSFEVRLAGGSFEGKANSAADEISGEWKQGGRTMSLVFKRAASPASSTPR